MPDMPAPMMSTSVSRDNILGRLGVIQLRSSDIVNVASQEHPGDSFSGICMFNAAEVKLRDASGLYAIARVFHHTMHGCMVLVLEAALSYK